MVKLFSDINLKRSAKHEIVYFNRFNCTIWLA